MSRLDRESHRIGFLKDNYALIANASFDPGFGN